MKAFVRYVCSKLEQINKEQAYRFYIANAVQMISENTARAVSGGRYISMSLADLLNPQPVEERDGLDIAKEIAAKVGLEIIE